MLEDMLLERSLPDVWAGKEHSAQSWTLRREEIKKLLSAELMGFAPGFPLENHSEILSTENDGFGGKASISDVDIRFSSPFAHASFPCKIAIPSTGEGKYPAFVAISFTHEMADTMAQELIDNGYAVASFCYQDVAPDRNDDFQNGLARFCTRNAFDSWGKISMWAFAASRVADFLMQMDKIDKSRVAVTGHSRLGKTALWCGALDERFSLTVSNESGAGGAAIFRGKTGEKLENLARSGSHFWFCENLFRNKNERELPFDQHFLLSLIAPRNLYVASAQDDAWADPLSEQLSCAAASKLYEELGATGLVLDGDALPIADKAYYKGKIGYHMRCGTHYFTRDDWQKIMQYRRLNDC